MLRSEFDKLPIIIVDKIIRNTYSPGITYFQPFPDCSSVPIMNQTWKWIIDTINSSFAAEDLIIRGSNGTTLDLRYPQYRLESVIAKGHQGFVKKFWLRIGFSSENYASHIDELCERLQGNVFPAANYLELNIFAEASQWAPEKIVQMSPPVHSNAMGSLSSLLSRLWKTCPEPISCHDISHLSAKLGQLLLSSFPNLKTIEAKTMNLPGTIRSLIFSEVYSSFARTIQNLRNFGRYTEDVVSSLRNASLQYIMVSNIVSPLWPELTRRNSKTLQRLSIYMDEVDISSQLLTDSSANPIIYPQLNRLNVCECKNQIHLTGDINLDRYSICHFPRLKYLSTTDGIPLALAKAALASSGTIAYLSIEHGDAYYKVLTEMPSATSRIFRDMQVVSINMSLYSSVEDSRDTGADQVRQLNALLNIGPQIQHYTYSVRHTVQQGAFSALSLHLPLLRVLDIANIEMSVIDMLYLVSQLPSLYRLVFGYDDISSPNFDLATCSDEQIAGVRDELPIVSASRLQEFAIKRFRTRGYVNVCTRQAYLMLILVASRLPLVTRITPLFCYSWRTSSTEELDIAEFTRRPIFDSFSHVRNIFHQLR